MAKHIFEVELPNGELLEIEAPEDTAADKIRARAHQYMYDTGLADKPSFADVSATSDYDSAAIERETAQRVAANPLPTSTAPAIPAAGDFFAALTAPLRDPLGAVRSVVDRGSDFVRGIANADLYDALERGATDMLASGIQTGGDFIDRTVQQASPMATLARLAGNEQAAEAFRDPLGVRAAADQAAAVNAAIGADRQTAMADLGRPSLTDFITNPSAATQRMGARLATQGVESVPGFALALASRNPELGANVLGAITGAQEYTDLTGEGVAPRDAIEAAALSALVERAGEGLALPKVMAKGPLGGLLDATLAEGGQELPVSIAQTNIQDMATGKETPIVEQLLGGLEAAATGAGLGLGGYGANNLPGWIAGDTAPSNAIAPIPADIVQAMAAPQRQVGPPPAATPIPNATGPAPVAPMAAPSTLDTQDDAALEAELIRNLLGDDIAAALDLSPATPPAPSTATADAAPSAPGGVAATPNLTDWIGGQNVQRAPVAPQQAAQVKVQPYQPQVQPQPATPPTPAPAEPAATLPDAVPATAADRPQGQPTDYRGKLWQTGSGRSNRSVQAYQLDDGTFMVRRRKGGQWQPWERKATFTPSRDLGYSEAYTPSGSINIPGVGRLPTGKYDASAKRETQYNPLLDLIVGAGGISREDAARMGVDPQEVKTANRGVGKPLFGKKGIALDSLRELMIEQGYFAPENPNEPSQIGVNEVWEQVERALAGEPVGPMGDPRMDEIRAQQYADRYGPEDEAQVIDPDEELADWLDSAEREQGEFVDPDEEAEALTVAQLANRAAEDGFGLARQMDEPDSEYAARLWDHIQTQEAERGTVREDEEGAVRGRVREGEGRQAGGQAEGFSLQGQFQDAPAARQEVTAPAGLFGAPTGRDYLDAATRAKDAARDGRSGTGRNDMAAGDGELFAGTRPAQARVDEASQRPPPESRKTASWVLREKATGRVIAETFDRKKVDALNTERYEAVPVQQHLAELNDPTTLAYRVARGDGPGPTESITMRRAESRGGDAEVDAIRVGDTLTIKNGIGYSTVRQNEDGTYTVSSGAELAATPEEAVERAQRAAERSRRVAQEREAANNGTRLDKVLYALNDHPEKAVGMLSDDEVLAVAKAVGRKRGKNQSVLALRERISEGPRAETIAKLRPAIQSVLSTDSQPTSDDVLESVSDDRAANFRRWSNGAPLVENLWDYEGGPAVFRLLHGTTADFDAFDRSRANPESDMGAGFYFSNTPADVGANYAGLGPDLTAKIEREAERIASETDRDYGDPDVVSEARAKFMQHDGATMPVFVRVMNPAIVGGESETRFTFNEPYDEETDSFDEPEGTLIEFMDALRVIEGSGDFDDFDAEKVIGDIFGEHWDGDSIGLHDMIGQMKGSEGMAYATDASTGDMAGSEIIRQALERVGFDGIVDYTVDMKFGSQRDTGQKMAGMGDDTVHVIAFEPTQIKSVFNRGAFDPARPGLLERTDQDVSDVDPGTLTDAERAAFGLDDRTAKLREAVDAALGPVASQVQYLRSWRDLPQGRLRSGVESRLKQRGGNGQTAALFDPKTGDVYLFTDANPSPERAVFNVLHEIAGHKGLRAFLGKDLDKALDLAAQNPTVMAVAEAIALERGIDASTDAGQRLAVEEALAELAAAVRTGNYDLIADRYGVTVPQGIRERVAAAVANFLRRLKALLDGKFGQTFSDADVRALLENAWQAAQGPTLTVTLPDGSVKMEQVVFHGTPHTVDRFSLQKIGTGEGAQAYGWGLYFASQKAIAKSYRNALGKTTERYTVDGKVEIERDPNGRPLDITSARLAAILYVGDMGQKGAEREFAGRSGLYAESVRAAIEALRGSDVRKETDTTGKLYQVEVPEDGDLLDYDKPLSEQPEKVKAALREMKAPLPFYQAERYALPDDAIYGDLFALSIEAADPEHTGGWLYQQLVQDMHDAKDASEALLAAGIPGLRYLDGGSRPQNTHDGQVIRALEKHGNDPAAAADFLANFYRPAAERAAYRETVFKQAEKLTSRHNYVIWDEAAIGEPEALLESVAEAEGRAEQNRNVLAGELPVSRGTPGWHYDERRWEGRAGAAKRARMELQDKMLAWRDVQNQVEGQIGQAIPDAQNVYRAETLMHGRVAERLDRIERDEVKPLLEAMKAAKVSPETLEEYLYARHAKERNAKIAAINPAMPEGGSGMTDAEADAILANADRARLDPLAARVDAITRANRRRLLGAGLITQEAHDAMAAQYQHYVPLRGKPDATDLGGTAGRGIDTRRQPVKQALGRRSRAANILGEVIGDAQRGVILAEKARVGKAVMRLVLANPNPDLWTVEPVQTERALDANGEVYERVVNDWSDPSVVAVRVAGKLYKVQIQQPQLAQALNNVGVDQLGAVTRAAGAINRYFSAVLTKYNPAFVPVNATRDALFGLTGLAVEKGEAVALDAALHYPQAILAAGKHAAGASGTGQWDQWAREFAEAGGKTGYVAMPSVEDLQRQVANVAVGGSKARLVGAVKPLVDTIGVMNDAVENALRLSAYVSLRKRGESAEAAAEYAKNLTVNFNRKGLSGSKLNAWFLFYNAAIQGAHRTSKLLRKPKTYAYLGALAGAQVIAAMFAMGLEDDEGEPLWNKIPDHVKRRNLVIVHPSGHVLTIPMPYGFNLFTYMASRTVDVLASKERKASNSAAAVTGDLLSAASESFVPVPIGDGALGFLPTVLRIPTNVQTNRNDFGRAIRTEQPYAKSDVPRASMGRPDTLELFKLTAAGLNRLGGGDDFTPPPLSWFDRAPEDLEYLLGELTGGAGKFVVDVATVGQQAMGGKMTPDLQAKDIPITKRFVTNIDEQASQRARFFERREVIDRGLKRVRSAYRTKGPEAAETLLASMPELSGAAFRRRKRDGDNGPAGSIIEVDGAPQIIASGPGTVFGAYKAADEAMSATREGIEDAFTSAPAGIIANDKTRMRDANIRQQKVIDQQAQAVFNAAWVRDVVGAAEKSD